MVAGTAAISEDGSLGAIGGGAGGGVSMEGCEGACAGCTFEEGACACVSTGGADVEAAPLIKALCAAS